MSTRIHCHVYTHIDSFCCESHSAASRLHWWFAWSAGVWPDKVITPGSPGWRMCFSWARTMLSLADCVEAIKELDRMIVTFLRTPLESASASQWEYTKWPPQSDESYVMCAFQCSVHVLGQLFRLESPRWLCVFLLLWSWGSLWSMLVRSMDGCVWRMFFLISFGLVQRWVWLTAWKQ